MTSVDEAVVLAGDVGGTNLRIAAVDRDGTIVHQADSPTPDRGTAEDVVNAIVAGARSCIEHLRPVRPAVFGLAIAALVNHTEGRILSSPNLPQLNDLNLAKSLAGELDLKVVLENDATAAAVGEFWLGSSKGFANSVLVTLGTGVGGGLILNGAPYRGVDGTAGEIGHICVEPDGVRCGCGSRGCVEQYASATAITRIANELSTSGSPQERFPDAKAVYTAAVEGLPAARKTFEVMGRYLGIALSDMVDVLNPELIVIGGGASSSWDFFIDHVRAEISFRAFKHPADRVRLVRAGLGNSAGILGAARLAFDALD